MAVAAAVAAAAAVDVAAAVAVGASKIQVFASNSQEIMGNSMAT